MPSIKYVDRFTDEERASFYTSFAYLDANKDFVITDKDTDALTYTDRIKSHEKISGRPSDEELTRALILLHFIYDYGFDPDRIEIEDRFTIGGRRDEKARAIETDIILKNKANKIESICEIKRIHDYHGVEDKSIKKQLFDPFNGIVKYHTARFLYHLSTDVPISPDHFPLHCIAIDTSIAKTYEDWIGQGRTPHFLDVIKPDEKAVVRDVFVKLSSEGDTSLKGIKDLDSSFGIDIIRRKWREIWDYIWGGTLEDNKKFENFNKVLLSKIYDERKTRLGTAYTFQWKYKMGKPQTLEELANDIDLNYRKAFREYLSKDKSIELKDINGIDFKAFPPSLVGKCVELLQPISFHKNRYKNVDVLGEFYEMVIREAFKQTKGLFLTHPNIVLFILAILDLDDFIKVRLQHPDQDIRYRLPFVIDPSCGTGTFLIHYMKYVQKYIEENNENISSGDEDVIDFIQRNVLGSNANKWVIDYVYGIDNEHVLATASQLNMILHGDGSTNIFGTDGLDNFNEYAKFDVTGSNNILSSNTHKPNYYGKDCLNRFDIVISNPPFNVNINKAYIQSNFEVTGKSEAYFLERWYQLLKPGGRIGVVLPESFFSVEDDISGRLFLYKHFNIRAIVSLPNHAFQPHTTTSTSLLFACKKMPEEEAAFHELWQEFTNEFNQRYSRFNAMLPLSKDKIDFSPDTKSSQDNVINIVSSSEEFLNQEFGTSFIIMPFFDSDFLFNEANFSRLKARLRNTVKASKDRWILHQVTKILDTQFHNFMVSNIGYKAGKKGSKDKPNELMVIYNAESNKIYNLKYAHSWSCIDFSNSNTVLGIIRGLNIWEYSMSQILFNISLLSHLCDVILILNIILSWQMSSSLIRVFRGSYSAQS